MNTFFRLLCALAVAAALAPAASASNLIDRNATNVKLEVNKKGMALLTYKAGGKLKHVLAWDAVNARLPDPNRPQVQFKLDYSGGWALSKKLPLLWQRFKNTCRKYRGPAVPWFVTGCTARDGSHWVLQSWQRMLPNYGVKTKDPMLTVWELRLSHWKGALPVFTVHQDWAYRQFENIFGSYTYLGRPMHGFATDRFGAPLDRYGLLIYVDTLNSVYGPGWMRENSFVTHKGTGIFCYGFFPHKPHPAGNGQAYRATAVGPGVLPDLMWQGASLGAYNPERDLQQNQLRKQAFEDKLCNYN